MEAGRNQRAGDRVAARLLEKRAITQTQYDTAREAQTKWGGDLGRLLVEHGFINEPTLLRLLALELGIRLADPATDPLDIHVVTLLGVQACERFGVIAVGFDAQRRVLQVAVTDAEDLHTLQGVSNLARVRVEPVLATHESIQKAIRKYYYGDGQGSAPMATVTPLPPSAQAMSTVSRAPTPLPVIEALPEAPAEALDQEVRQLRAKVDQLERILRLVCTQVNSLSPPDTLLSVRVDHLESQLHSQKDIQKALLTALTTIGYLSQEELDALLPGSNPR